MVVLSAREIAHIKALRARTISGGRSQPLVLVSQSNNPIGLAVVTALALPGAPTVQDGGPGGTFPGGGVYAQIVALNALGQTLAGAQAGPVAVAANHLCLIAPAAVANATSYRVYASTASGGETFAGTLNPGQTLTVSAAFASGQEAAPYTSYTLVNGILRHERGINPSQLDETGVSGDRRLTQILLELTVDTNTDGLVLVADCAVPNPATVNLPATFKYIPIDLIATGIVPGGDRKVGMLRRIQ
ncbi:MAG TPA: hypothetical protein VMW62_08330 [Chloroflexota bacterium]|nr:hypothetical protein [Chloroflexota bacterium]